MTHSDIEIIDFAPNLKEAIKTLNYEWLQKSFKLEPGDIKTLADPQQHIIDKGGFIFYAKMNGQIVGTASLIHKDGVFELSKMAVTESAKGRGIGKLLLEHCFNVARQKNIDRLILYSNTSLTTAIHLYRKYGFVEIPLEQGIYDRADIKMEKIL